MGNKKAKLLLSIVLICTLLLVPLEVSSEEYNLSDTTYNACVEYGEQYSICPELLMAIIERESAGKPYVQNGSCKGLMQVSERWHAERMAKLGVTDLFDERSNILVGADYLYDLFMEYNDPAIALMVYNGDSRAFEDGYISDYASSILERSAQLERQHGK